MITAAGAGSYFHVIQQVECEQWMVGQTFTISGWVKTNVSGQKIRVCDDAGCHLLGSAITADGTWQRIEVTHTLPTNEVVGNAFQVHPAFGNHLTTQIGDYLHWSEFQMELGTKATPFEHRTYGEELRLCQRYYWQNENVFVYSKSREADRHRDCTISLPVEMRATPTVTKLTDPGGFTASWVAGGKQSIRMSGIAPSDGYVDTCGTAKADAEF